MENAAVVTFPQKATNPNRIRCTKCGTTIDAPCECGVPYEYMKASALARIGLEETPNLSNHAIARRMAISDDTVKRQRDQLSQSATVEPIPRTGIDGVVRRLPEPIWTPERDAEMERLLREGLTYKDVGIELGTTDGAVSGRWARIQANKLDPKSRGLPEIMPDDVLVQASRYFGMINSPLHDLESLTMYAGQMHEDTRHAIAEYLKIIGDLSRIGVKRLIGDPRDLKRPQCGVEIKIRKDAE